MKSLIFVEYMESKEKCLRITTITIKFFFLPALFIVYQYQHVSLILPNFPVSFLFICVLRCLLSATHQGNLLHGSFVHDEQSECVCVSAWVRERGSQKEKNDKINPVNSFQTFPTIFIQQKRNINSKQHKFSQAKEIEYESKSERERENFIAMQMNYTV